MQVSLLPMKYVIQVNFGEENQKSGIHVSKLANFYTFCKDLNLNIVGLMCIPPVDGDADIYFKKMQELKKQFNFKDLSMGMSSDYLKAAENLSTYIRIGSNIFGQRN